MTGRNDDDLGPTTDVMPVFRLPDEAAEDLPPVTKRASALGTLLVIDSDPGQELNMLLRAEGYRVISTDDAITATQILASERVDAVLTDIAVRGMSGLELLAFTREHDVNTPILLVTGAPDVESAARAVELGAFQYLLRPLPHERLTHAVHAAVAFSRTAARTRDAARMFEQADTVLEQGPTYGTFLEALDRLWMAYQPIRQADGTIYAYEALMRSKHEELARPDHLLDAAEKLGGLPMLGSRVRDLTSSTIRDRADGWSMFVNLHPADLLDETLTTDENPLIPLAGNVVLEITERAALHDANDVRDKMNALREFGFRIALDDLGAGYAGLTSFATLSPEIVKLDMALVRDIDKDPLKQRLVRSMTELSRDMGILVVAEGIETSAERDKLQEIGCDLFQGYLLGKPGPMT